MNPSWIQIALAEQGQSEIAGSKHNPRIVAYHQTVSMKARDDETPWCASFVEWCLREAGLRGTGSAAARSYEDWGVFLDKPVLGAIVTFTRPGGGHVGFYMGQRDGQWLILGGNQSNRVSIAPYDPSRMTSIRWPSGVPLPNAVAPLSKSGVIKGNVVAATGTVASIGVGLIENSDQVNLATGWVKEGTIIAIVLGLVALAGIAWSILSRVQGKKAENSDV
jgi:uncharacterized protein (TIGR02594 family)